MALARYLSKEDLEGRSAVELGCGVGLPSVVALTRGAEVTATDYYLPALDFTRYNARVNLGREPGFELLDWYTSRSEELESSFDLVFAADVLYEARNVPALAALIPNLLAPGGEVLLADPRRNDAPAFLKRMREKGFCFSTEECLVPELENPVLVHRLWRY